MEHTKNSCGRYRFFEATRISRRQMIACLALALSTFSFQHSALRAQDTVRSLDEVMIQDARVSNKAPLTTSTVDRKTPCQTFIYLVKNYITNKTFFKINFLPLFINQKKRTVCPLFFNIFYATIA